MKALLQGGPDHGKVVDIAEGRTSVCCPVKPQRFEEPGSRYRLAAKIGDLAVFKYQEQGGAHEFCY